MSDTTIVWDSATGYGDWQLVDTQLLTGNDLHTAVLISLFTDRVANPDDVIPDGTTDPRGWWGDDPAGPPIGSRLWLLSRAKQTTDTLNHAKDYITEALQWLIDDGVVASFDIYIEWTGPGFMGSQIVAHQPVGTSVTMNYSWTWKGIN